MPSDQPSVWYSAGPGLDQRARDVFDVTLHDYRRSVRDVIADSAYGRYVLWATSPQNPHYADYLVLIGLSTLVKLTATLLDGLLIGEREWQRLVPAVGVMNAWQLHEVVSDNLALGLAGPPQPQRVARSPATALLLRFNALMVQELSSRTQADAIRPVLEPLSATVSLWDHSLSARAHRGMAERYAAYAGIPARSLEYCAWAPLLANLHSARPVYEQVRSPMLRAAHQASFTGRYTSISTLIEQPPARVVDRVALGTDAILVLPTLAYYIDVLTRDTPLEAALQDSSTGHILARGLSHAGTAVRLLNDLGTPLAEGQQPAIRAALDAVRENWNGSQDADLATVLADRDDCVVLTRLRKDARHAEHNVCLDAIRHLTDPAEAVDALAVNLREGAALYQRAMRNLRSEMRAFRAKVPHDTVCAALIQRFVNFHHNLYSRPCTDAAGEYAVLNDRTTDCETVPL
jgi:hypothetical protein